MSGSLRGVPVPLVMVVLGCAFLCSGFPCIAMRRGCSGGALCELWFDLLVRFKVVPVCVVCLLDLFRAFSRQGPVFCDVSHRRPLIDR